MKSFIWAMCLIILMPTYGHSQDCHIVTSFSILQDITKNITGNACMVTTIVGPNQDAHIFEPKPSTNKLILEANVIIINGLNFEQWMTRLVKAAHYQGSIIESTRNIQARQLYDPKKGLTPVSDPHAWHTIPNVLSYIQVIAEELSNLFPQYATTFKNNAQAYSKELQKLEDKFQKALKSVPFKQRVIITAHDAFAYMGAHYGIKVLSPVGISTEAEPSAKQVAALIDLIKSSGIKALFIENIANQKLIQQIAHETGLVISGELYSDALSNSDGPASTYIDLMRHNIELLILVMQKNCI